MLRNCLLVVAGAAALSVPARAEDRVVRSVVQTDLKTGKLVRRTVVAGSSPASRPAPQISELIDRIAAKNEVESPLVRSVIRAESNYNPLAVSNKGAQGLMQLIPSTAKRFGVKDSFDSEENIEGGVKYLKYLIALFHGDYAQAVAAYNAGEAAVAKYGGVPPYKETQNYVAEVARHLAAERRTVAAQAVAQGPAEAVVVDAAPVETYNPIVASVSPDGIVSYKTP
jgi:soluble lytic murein transglycosylase-like protein